MLKRLLKVSSICLLISIPLSLPTLQVLSQQRSNTGASEITFFGKEETKWTEKRELPLPVVMGQGVKEEPWMDSFDLREEGIGPMMKMSPSTTVPGCGLFGQVHQVHCRNGRGR